MRKILFLTTLLAFVLTSSVWAADISGTWTVKMQGPGGQDESFDLIIKDAGGNLTITGTHPALKELAGAGTVKGDAVTMSVKPTNVKMPVEFAFTGKLAGNKISGTREITMNLPKPGTKEAIEAEAESAASAAKEKAAGKVRPPAPAPKPKGEISKAFTAEKK